METAICPKCGQPTTGETTLYHCQFCGQSLHGVPRRLATEPAQQPRITNTKAEPTVIVQGRFRKARVRPLKKYGQYRGRGQLEVGPNVVTIRGKHVYSLGARWGLGLTLFFGSLILTMGAFAPGFILIYLIVEYWWLKKEDRTVLFSSITGVALDATRQLLAIEFLTYDGGSAVVLKSPEASTTFQALQSSRSGQSETTTDMPGGVTTTCRRCGHTWTGHWDVSLKDRQCPQCGERWRVT
jgi:hypothetical protein